MSILNETNRYNIPNELISSLARRVCVVIIGSGVSKNSKGTNDGKNPLTWKDFLISANAKYNVKKHYHEIRKNIDNGDFLMACELLKDQLDKNEYIDLLESEFVKPKYQPNKLHELIHELDASIVITPNFDKIYENAEPEPDSVTVKTYSDLDIVKYIRNSNNYRLLIKMHGCIANPSSVIFTTSDYANARIQHAHFYDVLKALSLTHTFLFIGCGLDDPDTKQLLEDNRFRFEQLEPHYILLSEKNGIINSRTKNEIKLIEDQRNLKVLTYPYYKNYPYYSDYSNYSYSQINKLNYVYYPSNPTNPHIELENYLICLVNAVKMYRDELSNSQQW